MKYHVCQDVLLRKFFISVTLCFLLATFTSTGWAECTLKTGWEPWQPFQYQDQNGNLTGLDIDMVTAILENMNCQPSFSEMAWQRILVEIERGGVDFCMGAGKSAAREEFAYFSAPYRQESFVLYVRKGETGKYQINSLEDISAINFNLGVVRGYYYGDEYAALIEKPEFKKFVQEVEHDNLNYTKLIKGRIDGFLAEPIVATSGLKENGQFDMVEIHPVKVYASDIHVMFSKQSVDPEIVKSFDESLAELKANGTHGRILEKYLQ